MTTYPELKEYKDFADAMGMEMDVEFYDSGIPGLWLVSVAVGGIMPQGPIYFSFDKKRIFNFWSDYPDRLTPEQIKKFNEWNDILAALKGFGGYPPDATPAQDSASSIWDTRF